MSTCSLSVSQHCPSLRHAVCQRERDLRTPRGVGPVVPLVREAVRRNHEDLLHHQRRTGGSAAEPGLSANGTMACPPLRGRDAGRRRTARRAKKLSPPCPAETHSCRSSQISPAHFYLTLLRHNYEPDKRRFLGESGGRTLCSRVALVAIATTGRDCVSVKPDDKTAAGSAAISCLLHWFRFTVHAAR